HYRSEYAGMVLADPGDVELVLQRYSWALDALAVLIGAYLAARTVNTIAVAAIAPRAALVQQAGPPPQAAAEHQRVEPDAATAASTNTSTTARPLRRIWE